MISTVPQSILRSSLVVELELRMFMAIVGVVVGSGSSVVCSEVEDGVGCILFKVVWGLSNINGKPERLKKFIKLGFSIG